MVERTEEAIGYKEYTPTYHAMHRNSLIASTLLLLGTFPGVKVDLSKAIFVEQLPNWFDHVLPWGLLITATYFFFYFLNEWELQALKEYRRINNFVLDAIKGVEGQFEGIAGIANAIVYSIQPSLETYRDIEPANSRPLLARYAKEVVDKSQAFVAATITDIRSMIQRSGAEGWENLDRKVANIEATLPDRPPASETWLNGTVQDFDKRTEDFHDKLREWRDNQDRLMDLLGEARSILSDVKRGAGGVTASVKRKAMLFGLAAPSALYLAGCGVCIVTHGLGLFDPPAIRQAPKALPAKPASSAKPPKVAVPTKHS